MQVKYIVMIRTKCFTRNLYSFVRSLKFVYVIAVEFNV